MGWRVTDLAEHEAHEQAADLNVTFNQYGQRDQADRIEVNPPIEVQSATWSAAGQLDWWVKDAGNGGVVYAGQTVDRNGSKLQIFGLPRRAYSRELSLSVTVGSLLAHCQNKLSVWIIRAAALTYARQEVPPILLAPRSKQPLIWAANGSHGPHDATNDLDMIKSCGQPIRCRRACRLKRIVRQ
jgi:hypothetical protein